MSPATIRATMSAAIHALNHAGLIGHANNLLAARAEVTLQLGANNSPRPPFPEGTYLIASKALQMLQTRPWPSGDPAWPIIERWLSDICRLVDPRATAASFQQAFCPHVGGLGPPFPFCEICDKAFR